MLNTFQNPLSIFAIRTEMMHGEHFAAQAELMEIAPFLPRSIRL